MDYLNVVEELNERLLNTKYEELYVFSYYTTGYVEVISIWLDGYEINLWCSEYDECQQTYNNLGYDGDYDKKFFMNWIVNEFSKLSETMMSLHNTLLKA